jgi:thiol-disulfide isomerase/thioredoxin
MPRRIRHLLPLVAAIAAVVLVGCGGADPAETTTDPDAGAGPPADSPAPADDPAAGPGDDEPAAEAPESLSFTGTTVGGEAFDAAELAGEPVVLWFWAPWCPICRGAAPDVLAAAEKVTMVGVGGLDQESAMQGFVDDTGTGDLTHLSDPDGTVWQKFEVTYQHTYVLIDAAGEVQFTGSLDREDLLRRVDELAG